MKQEEKTGQDRQRRSTQRTGADQNKRSAQATRRPAASGTKTPVKKKMPAPERKKTAQRPEEAAVARRRTRKRTEQAVRENPVRQKEPLPEVVYLPPKQFNRNRFLLHLATLVAVVLALTFAFSIFFKVKTITVSGTVRYDVWTVREASGIKEGEGLLSFGSAKAAGKIRTLLPYVKEVQIGIKLPDTVKIEIVESTVAYSIVAVDGTWWLMSAEGKILEQIDKENADNYTKIVGIELATPVGENAQAYEEVLQNAFGETIPVSITAQERLNTVKQILQNLEMNEVLGDVTTLDVTNPMGMQMWFGEKYQVNLGDGSRIAHKIDSLCAVFDQEEFLEPGIIDVTFTNEEHPKDVIFVPFTD